jgi:asparagine synthase (glutamine-hydrolysing)
MCGILGFTGRNNPRLLKRLLGTMRHRGFDDQGFFAAGGLNLAMNRLAINDLRRGLYPMTYKHYVLVFNGEIYNYPHLKKQLEKVLVPLTSRCDAEVILPLFHRFGPKAFTRLEGMFAFAIFDRKKKQLILARDKAGEKPLYFLKAGSALIFASEMKAIIAYAKYQGIPVKLDLPSLVECLSQGFVAGSKTLLQSVAKLPPAHYVVYDLRSLRLIKKAYWNPPVTPLLSIRSEESARNHLTSLIQDSVAKRLLSDVPVGCFLSGGLDSSLVTYFAAQHLPNLKTFSITFPESLRHNEADYSSLVASWLGTDHTVIPCTGKTVAAVVHDIGEYIDEPVIDPAVLPTFLLAKQARRSVKVVLTGEGADELFGGYHRYLKELALARLQRLARRTPFLNLAYRLMTPDSIDAYLTPLAHHDRPQTIWRPSQLRQLLDLGTTQFPISAGMALRLPADTNPLLAMQLTDFRGYLPEQLLMKIDKITMRHTLEARAPYLDTRLTNFALRLPRHLKIKGIHGKYLLKQVAQTYFPKSFVWRLKHGFSVPLDRWLRADLRTAAQDSLADLKAYQPLFNITLYRQVIQEHLDNRSNHKHKIWSMIVLTQWLKHYKISL